MRDVQKILEALSSPVRRDILWLVWDEELPAGAIAARFELSAPTISEHLAILREAELVSMQAEGSFRLYRARRPVLHGLQPLFADETSRWAPADDTPESQLAMARTGQLVMASVGVGVDRPTAFAAFTNPDSYSRWLGVPVTIDAAGRFACTMEWGTRVRGHYDVVSPPSLIALRWDFEDDNIPVPGNELPAYMRFTDAGSGCYVEVHQLVDSPDHAEFMEAAWTMVLGRFKQGAGEAAGPSGPIVVRRPRAKKKAARTA